MNKKKKITPVLDDGGVIRLPSDVVSVSDCARDFRVFFKETGVDDWDVINICANAFSQSLLECWGTDEDEKAIKEAFEMWVEAIRGVLNHKYRFINEQKKGI